MIKYTLFFLLSLLSIGCSEKNQVTTTEESIAAESSLPTIIDTTEAEETETEDGPPFKVDCPCSFADLGRVRVSAERYDVLVSGTDWNPKLNSCNWIWGELVNNEVPPDTLITDLRIHLLDLNKVEQKIDRDFLESRTFKENLIATHSKQPREEYMTTKFDPNKTGKYADPNK
jgi:hypothetical protein